MKEHFSKNEVGANPVKALSLSGSGDTLLNTWLDKPRVLESECPLCGSSA